MDLDLKEIGITLIVGSFTVLTFEYIVYYVFGRPITGFFKGRLGLHDQEDTTAVVFLFLCFGIGLVTEDVLAKYIERLDVHGISRALICHELIIKDLKDEGGNISRSRLETATIVAGIAGQTPQRTDLGGDLLDNHLFARIDGARGRDVERWLRNPTPVNERKQKAIEESIQHLWYAAKNRVYRDERYSEEMRHIQSRLEFSRTIACVAFLGWLAFLVLGAARLLLDAFVRVVEGKKPDAWAGFAPAGGWWLLRAGFLFAIYFFSLWAYSRESLEFNKRTFGYYNAFFVSARVEPHHERD
jgi:hypothetical protein